MRPLIFALALTLAGGDFRGASHDRPEIRAAFPLRVVYELAALDGICALVAVEPHGTGIALYFITSARLFKTAQGEVLAPAADVRVMMDDGTEVNVPREYRYLPTGSFSDIAVLRADVATSDLVPAAMGFLVPPPGRAVEIAAYTRGGMRQVEMQQVRFTSTRFIVGDGDLSNLACVGAPAIDGDEIVGVVSECEPGRAPLITPLSVAFSFLARQIPGLTGRPTLRE
jgi:hypothetical protein